jgi:hypothetical protein
VLEPIRTARVIGVLVLLQGMIFLLFWKIFGWAIAVGIERYSNLSGKMAKAFFSQDKTLMQLLQTGTNYLPILLVLGSIISACGILMLAFPKQTVRILITLRVFKRF